MKSARETPEAAGSPSRAADVLAMVGALGDIGEALNRAEPTMLGSLYEALRMEAVYDAEAHVVTVTIRPAAGD